MSFGVHVKNYEHYSYAMGKHIKSKAHYEKEMAMGGYIDYETGKALAEKHKREQGHKVDKKKIMEIVNAAKLKTDRKGRVRLDDRMIEAINRGG